MTTQPLAPQDLDLSQFEGATPGPWAAADVVGTADKGHTYIFSTAGEMVACVLHACQSTPPEYTNTDRILRARADARLIAAAPQLIAELCELRIEAAELRGQRKHQ